MPSLGTNPAEVDLQLPAVADRRRRVRHKVRIPAYASVNSNTIAPALELSEIVDISEQGMAIQSSCELAAGQEARFLLDLPETNALIPIEGKVIWSALSGRAGIQFSEMPEQLSSPLKKWLFANALAACVDYAIPTDNAQQDLLEEGNAAPEDLPPIVHPDHTSILAALDAVKREIEALGNDLDAALYLLARRAQAFTRASGAAIALIETEKIETEKTETETTDAAKMICRATAGGDAPPLGARVEIGSGFSGECVRTGALLRCDDSETDPRVNRESCQVLGIRSIAATPIRSDESIIGLLEVFSPEVEAFGAEDELVLSRLAEIISAAVHRAQSPQDTLNTIPPNVDDEFVVEDHTEVSLPDLPRPRNGFLIATVVTLLVVVGWLIGTREGGTSRRGTPTQPQQQKVDPQPSSPTFRAGDLQTMRRLAEQGDPIAQFAIGARYATGEDVPQDYGEAVRWFGKAAEQGHVPAQATLGAYYWAGRGVPVDLAKAYFWSLLAEAGGDEASKSRVALLASRLDRAQIVIAQHHADEWIRKHQLAGKSAGAAQ